MKSYRINWKEMLGDAVILGFLLVILLICYGFIHLFIQSEEENIIKQKWLNEKCDELNLEKDYSEMNSNKIYSCHKIEGEFVMRYCLESIKGEYYLKEC